MVLIQSLNQVRKKKKRIIDVGSWCQAYASFVAALASLEATSKEEMVGLMAHQHVVLQMQKDLGGMKWLLYDQQYREWAGATRNLQWGDIYLTIYGWCLSLGPPSGATQRQYHQNQSSGLATSHPRRPLAPKEKSFKHNFEGGCSRSHADCHFDHVCWHCGSADHVGVECPRGPKQGPKFKAGE